MHWPSICQCLAPPVLPAIGLASQRLHCREYYSGAGARGISLLVLCTLQPVRSAAAGALRSSRLGRSTARLPAVTAATSLEAGLDSFAGGGAAFDCVLLEHELLENAAGSSFGEELFRVARLSGAPVVLMAGGCCAQPCRLRGGCKVCMQIPAVGPPALPIGARVSLARKHPRFMTACMKGRLPPNE